MKITFIRLNMFEHKSTDAMKPILFGLIRSLTPSEHDITFIDERVEKLPETINSDIIAFSVETYTAKRAYILAKKYKTDDTIIVMGGFHPSVLPDEALRYADTVIIGDAEDTWGAFLKDCVNGTPKRTYTSTETAPLLSFTENKSVYRHKYHKIGVVQTSRGCKFNCDFCSIKTMYRCVRRKSPEAVVQELKEHKEKIIFFADDNLFYDEASAIALLRAIAPLKKKWACQISMDAVKNETLLREMKKAGCFMVLMGFETLNTESLSNMNKTANQTISSYRDAIKRIYKHKMLIYGTFVFGYDHDTVEIFQKTLDFAIKNHLAVTNFNPLIPMPGTAVYRRLKEENRLLYETWWLSDTYRYGETAYLPKGMTPEQLRDGCLTIRTKFYSIPCILKRLFSSPIHFIPWNLLVFLLTNFISRKEIRSKQGQLLGGLLNETDVNQTQHRTTRT